MVAACTTEGHEFGIREEKENQFMEARAVDMGRVERAEHGGSDVR